MTIKNMKKIISMFAALILTGCATSNIPKYVAPAESPSVAYIGGRTANPFRFFTGDDSHVSVQEIDGLATGGSNGSFAVVPGTHSIGLMINGAGYRSATGYVNVDVKPGRKYQFTAALIGISFGVKFSDVTDDEPVTVSEMRMMAGASQPANVPVFIPMPAKR